MEAFQGGTTEDHLGVAVNQPGDSVIVKGKWPFFITKAAIRVEPRTLCPSLAGNCEGRTFLLSNSKGEIE